MFTRRHFICSGLLATAGLWLGGDLLGAPLTAGETTYTVKRGDTLSVIARRHGVTVATLQQRNRLKGDRILVGQKLVIPGTAATVHPGLAPVIAATKKLRVDARRWRHIVLHHSGIEDGNARAYDAGHRRRGMEYGLAYHFVIGNGRDSREGEIEIGPRWLKQQRGGHVRSSAVNENGIGICLVGNFEKRRPSARQLAAAYSLVDYLRDGLVHPGHKVTVHRWVDRNHTVCPGKNFPFADLKRRYQIT